MKRIDFLKNHFILKKPGVGLLVVCLIITGVLHPGFSCFSSQASSVSDLKEQQEKTQDKIDATKDKRDEKRDELKDIDDEAKEIDASINAMSKQMMAIDEKISAANADITETEKKIKQVQLVMEETQKAQDERYEIMKRHIVFFYENRGQTDVVSVFLRSGSFTEFLNRTEIISAIMEYDKQLIEQYESASEELLQASNELELEKERLSSRQKDLKSSQAEMDELMEAAYKDARKNQKERKKTAEELAAYESRLVTLKANMKALEASVAQAQLEEAKRLAEELAAQEAEGEREFTAGAYAASASDLTLLAATIEAEAGNQSRYGQQAVASVIMNRVKSSHFPNTIYGVIVQENQFASYRSGMVDAFIEKGPSQQCMEVAQEAIDGDRVGDWLFFMTVPYADKYGITGYEVIGDHAFFYVWGDN